MKKILSVILAISMILVSCSLFSSCSDDNFTIGICQFMEHDALDAATEGFKQAVIDELGQDAVEFNIQNGQNDTTICSTIINQFVSNDVDLIMANATPVLQVAAAATADIPIIGTSVTEYGVALDIDGFNGIVGGNISGSSDLAPLDKQADMITEWCPDAKRVALLYCSGEPNSRYQVEVVKSELEKKGLRVELYAFTDSNDLMWVCDAASNNCDVIYVPTDNTVAENSGIIDSICETKGIPVIAGEEGICAGCGIATLSVDYYDVGYTAGKMAARVLMGEDISNMQISYSAEITPKYNKQNCEALGITPLEGYTAIE